MTLRTVVLAGIVVIALFSAACAGGDDAEEPTNASSTTTPDSTIADEATTFDDAFAYCASVGTIDEPDARWAGDDVAASLMEAAFPDSDVTFDSDQGRKAARLFRWRCFEGQVLGCSVGANLWCGLANTSREPSERVASYCRDNPDSPLSFAITGHDQIYLWVCDGATAVIGPQEPREVDERGFFAQLWREITPTVDES